MMGNCLKKKENKHSINNGNILSIVPNEINTNKLNVQRSCLDRYLNKFNSKNISNITEQSPSHSPRLQKQVSNVLLIQPKQQLFQNQSEKSLTDLSPTHTLQTIPSVSPTYSPEQSPEQSPEHSPEHSPKKIAVSNNIFKKCKTCISRCIRHRVQHTSVQIDATQSNTSPQHIISLSMTYPHLANNTRTSVSNNIIFEPCTQQNAPVPIINPLSTVNTIPILVSPRVSQTDTDCSEASLNAVTNINSEHKNEYSLQSVESEKTIDAKQKEYEMLNEFKKEFLNHSAENYDWIGQIKDINI
jgi:hypothetical protein